MITELLYHKGGKWTTYLFIFRKCGEDYCFYIETKYWMKMMWMDMYMFEMFYNITDIPYTYLYHTNTQGSSWPWSHGSWIYNYLCNQCISPLMLWVRISIRARCTTICDKVCRCLATCRWFSPPIKFTATI